MMKSLKGVECHKCAPKEWRDTPNLTGSFELDAMVMHTKNRDMADRLPHHVASGNSYGFRTGYSGYSGYSGDD
jgi:hypothetical protein